MNTEYRVLSQYAWKFAQPALPPVSTSISAYLFTRKSVRSTDRSSWQLVSSMRMMTRVVFLDNGEGLANCNQAIIRPALGTLYKLIVVIPANVVVEAHNAAAGLIDVVLDVIGSGGGRLGKPACTLFQHADGQVFIDAFGFDGGKSCLRRGPQ